MAQKMTGALVFDERTDRYDIRFDLKCNIYGKEWIFKRRNQNLYREGISL